MKSLKEVLNETIPAFFRFQVYVKDGSTSKKTVGMAYLHEGQSIYTLRLWTFLNEKFFLMPSQDDPTRYFIMTREANKIPNSKNKFFWNIVGHAKADASQSYFELSFDLIEKKIFMSIYPVESSHPGRKHHPHAADPLAA
jgi:hypothetical protein